MQLAIEIIILDKGGEKELAKKLGIGNRTRYRDKEGHLVFFKRIDSKEKARYRIDGVKIS